MTQMLMLMMMMISSMIFMQMNHPLAMGLMLLIQTLLISMISGLIAKTFWFSYILFLIFLGGMLVLFIYVASLASNEMFSMSMKLLMTSSLMIFTSIMIMLIMDKLYIYYFMENNEMIELPCMNSFNLENSINLMKLYNLPTNLITLLMINYLLLTLIASVKITNVFYGPLRKS